MKRLIIIFASVLCFGAARAQQDGFTSLHYDVGFGFGSTHDYISKPSFRGLGFDYKKMVNGNVGIGLAVGWQTFYEHKDKQTFDYTAADGSSVQYNGVQYRYLNAFPVHITTDYYFGENGKEIRPFVGLGVGTMFSERKTNMGNWSATENSWQFSLQPEVGLLYQVQSSAAFFFAGKYTMPFKNNTFDSQPYLALNVGVVWMLH
jgi:opacity protein-like surface antigen